MKKIKEAYETAEEYKERGIDYEIVYEYGKIKGMRQAIGIFSVGIAVVKITEIIIDNIKK